ncbi:hypothetical protein GRC12_04790 [Streptomyces griseorubiginosus]|nr:hypothetical protein [Streptomyces griseorubiginosus]
MTPARCQSEQSSILVATDISGGDDDRASDDDGASHAVGQGVDGRADATLTASWIPLSYF